MINSETNLITEAQSLGINIKRCENLGQLDVSAGELVVTATLCPLYAVGDLRSSSLISPPASLAESRVATKWSAGVNLLKAIRAAVSSDINIKSVLTFADQGVISNAPSPRDPDWLKYHEQVYTKAANADISPLGVAWEMSRYSDIVRFPTFISPGKNHDNLFSSSRQIAAEAEIIVSELEASGVVFTSNPDLTAIQNMLSELGRSLTRGLLRQYGSFDPLTTQPGALNTFFERSKLLLRVTDLFPHKRYPRLDILC